MVTEICMHIWFCMLPTDHACSCSISCGNFHVFFLGAIHLHDIYTGSSNSSVALLLCLVLAGSSPAEEGTSLTKCQKEETATENTPVQLSM